MTLPGESLGLEEAVTKKGRRLALEAKAIKHPCLDCGALIGEPCVSKTSGEIAAQMHKRRLRQASYMPVPR